MTITPGAPSDPLTIRLYDKIEEMRSDVAAMASDVRNLATKIEPIVTSVGDHEGRLRALEKDSVTTEELEAVAQRVQALERGSATKAEMTALDTQVQDLQRGRWKTAGAAVAVSVLASSGVVGVIATKVLGH